MKHFLSTLLITIVCLNTFGQDTIVKSNSDEVIVKILEVGPTEIKYKKWSYLDGPTFVTNISDISKIKYANGETESFSNNSTPSSDQKTNDNNQHPQPTRKQEILTNLRKTNEVNQNNVDINQQKVQDYYEYYPSAPSHLKVNGQIVSINYAKKILGNNTFRNIERNMKGIMAGYAVSFLGVPTIAVGIILLNGYPTAGISCLTLGALMISVGLPCALILPKINRAIVSSYNNISIQNHKQTHLNFTIAPNDLGIALHF